MPVQKTPREWPVPSAFIAASFAAKRAANEEAKSRLALAVGDFTLGEDAPQESIAVPLDHVRDALDFGRIEPDTYNLHPVASDPT